MKVLIFLALIGGATIASLIVFFVPIWFARVTKSWIGKAVATAIDLAAGAGVGVLFYSTAHMNGNSIGIMATICISLWAALMFVLLCLGMSMLGPINQTQWVRVRAKWDELHH